MSDRTKNTLIGIFLLVSCMIVLSMILFLKPHVGDGKKIYHVRFSNISGINKGTRVTFAGRPVGSVTEVIEIKEARSGPIDLLGRVYIYALTLKVDSSVDIYTTDEITIQTSGLLGEKSIGIIPKKAILGNEPQLVTTNKVIFADSQDAIENVINEVSTLSKKVEAIVSDLNAWFLGNEDNLSLAIKNFANVMGRADIFIAKANKEELVEKTSKSLDLLQDNLHLTYSTLAQVQDNNTIAKFTNTIEGFDQVAQNLNQVSLNLADGKGSLGKLINSDNLYLQFQSLLNKGQTLVNDVNHYGLLFQYNKSWQRQRVKRATLLNALKTPKEFQAYFETEVDQIQTSLTRLGALMEKAKYSKQKVVNNQEFQKDFKMLLSQIDTLSEEVKMYNESIVDLQKD